MGVRIKLTPTNKTEFWFYMLSAVFFGLGITLSREFSVRGFEVAGYVGAIANGVLLAFLLHKYSVLTQIKGSKSDA